MKESPTCKVNEITLCGDSRLIEFDQMQKRDALVGCIIGSISGFWVAQYLSTLPSWTGTPILETCSNLTYCSFIIPVSIVAVLIMISPALYEVLPSQGKNRVADSNGRA
ncbi:MAG: hypothetical protein ACHQ03_06270 [Candidatus Bathyarchaeia archaeon]